MQDKSNALVSVESAAQQLSLGVISIRRMVKSGKIKAYKLGHNTVRIAQADIDAFVASKQIMPAVK